MIDDGREIMLKSLSLIYLSLEISEAEILTQIDPSK